MYLYIVISIIYILLSLINKRCRKKLQQQISKQKPKRSPRRPNPSGEILILRGLFNIIFNDRLYVKGVFTGFKRGKTVQHEKTALLRIKGVNQRKDASYYFGKKVAYIWKGKAVRNNTKYRVSWGVVTSAHGNNGQVRARFVKNLTPRAMGAQVRVMLYPNRTI